MRNNKWLIGGLVVSLVLNLLLAGFVLGRMSGIGPPPFGPDPTIGFVRLLGFLGDDRRSAITPVLHAHMSEMLPMLHNMRRDQHSVIEALAAEPFVPEALANSLNELRENLTAAQVSSHQSFVAMATLLTSAERRDLAAAMRHPPRMHGGAGRSGRGNEPQRMHPGWGGPNSPQEDR